VWSDLQTLSTSNHTAEKQIRIIATALLTLNLASITGVGPNVSATEELTKSAQRKSRIAQAEKLYTDLLAVSPTLQIKFTLTDDNQACQSHGLFSATESPPPDAHIDEIMDIDARWKAWSRVESAKRCVG